MTESELYSRSDSVLGPYLSDRGFEIAQPGEYIRRAEEGRDRVLVSHGPGEKRQAHFAVWMSYYPNYMEILDDLVRHLGEPEGFPCGPYLNPVTVSRRPKYWSYRNKEALDKSVDHVLQCLDETGLPWLATLRDPKIFAANVDPVAALPAALAYEIAGDTDKARLFYEEMLRRYRLILQDCREESEMLRQMGRKFIFVSMKLRVEKERREDFQRKLGFYPDIMPLPS